LKPKALSIKIQTSHAERSTTRSWSTQKIGNHADTAISIFLNIFRKKRGKDKRRNSRVDLRSARKTVLIFYLFLWRQQYREWVRGKKTFGNGVLDFGAFEDNVVIVEAFLFFDEVIVVAIFAGGVRGSFSGSGELNLGDEDPLEEGEPYSNDGADRNQNLGAEIWENHCSHDDGWERERVKVKRGKK